MRNRKRRMENFTFYDYRAICTHLEQMAQKGWMLKRIGLFWEYERIEPARLHFAVSHCRGIKEEIEEKDGGRLPQDDWKQVCQSDRMGIYCCDREEAPPFGSTAKEELEAVHGIGIKRYLFSGLLVFAAALLQEWTFFSSLGRDFTGVLSDGGRLLGGICFLMVVFICLGETIGYILWYFRAKKEVLKGRLPSARGMGIVRRILFGMLSFMMILWTLRTLFGGGLMERWLVVLGVVSFSLLFGIVYAGMGWMKKRGLSGKGHMIAGMIAAYFISCFLLGFLTLGILKASDRGMFISDEKETYEYGGRIWEVSQDELPLKLEDLTGESYEEYTRENDKKESLLLRQESISQRPRLDAENFRELPELEYSLITVKLPVLYDRCRQALIREGERHYPEGDRIYQEEDAKPWGAIEAYRIHDSRYGFRNQYLICWENVLAEIYFPWEPDEGQKGIVGKNLNKLALTS